MPKPDKIPPCPDAPTRRSTGLVTRDYSIRLITPMFGGGVVAGEPDQSFPIRGTSIRGQLQFWWRATRGRLLGDSMWRREEEVFGSTQFPSPLEVLICSVKGVVTIDPSDAYDRFGAEAYALFPAVENQKEVLRDGLNFQLTLRWPDVDHLRVMRAVQNRSRDRKQQLPLSIEDITPDIEAAVWAWVRFGGLGGRTRRGVGAIQAEPLPSPPGRISSFDGKVFVGKVQKNAMDAWKESVRVYRDFRQTPRGPKHAKTIRTKNGPKAIQVPGRSHWPEADSIRQITGCALRPPAGSPASSVPPDVDTHDHSKPVVPHALLPAFPKAVLGLPINFHFSDGPGKHRSGNADKDPQDVQLVPVFSGEGAASEKDKRMASPVITRPLLIEGKWHPGVIILNRPHLNTLQARLIGERSMAGGGPVAVDIGHVEIANPALSILEPMRGKASAIDALVEYLATTVDFTEHTP